jgi:adenylate cyclase
MLLTPQIRMNIGRVAFITVCYIAINMLIAFYNESLLNSPFSAGPSDLFDHNRQLFSNFLIGLLAGILGGTMLVFINSKIFRKRSFRYAILATAIGYILVFVIVVVTVTIINIRIEFGSELPLKSMSAQVLEIVLDQSVISYFVLWGAITMMTLFLLQVNDKFGPGILIKFLIGKYHLPKEESRIFMFLDMRSSTTIAEKIGNAAYFNLLSDVYIDITDIILKNAGEIYQYVGDEVVISWTENRGSRNANCLRCFFQIQQRLKELGPSYIEKYGVAPEMKAGIHYGSCTAGEIGSIKKDIVYSGDVLNTTARIQGQCNNYKVNLIISDSCFDLLQTSEAYQSVSLGSIELRGKGTLVDLSTVHSN